MTYAETLAFLYQQLPMYHRIGAAAYKADLKNTIELLKALGNPELHFPSIHVAGTNGKGSVSHLMASVLQEAGYKTGLYTSPHLKDFRERIRINGEMIPEAAVVQFVGDNRNLFLKVQPSFFEMTVALAFQYFSRNAVDIAVIETGMGGRLDSTNVITPLLSVITNIGLDHTQFLGTDLPSIAREKAGIIKPGVPVVIGETTSETLPVFKEFAAELASTLHLVEHETWISPFTSIPGKEPLVAFDVSTSNGFEMARLSCPLTGWYQRHNFRTSLLALTLLPGAYHIEAEHILRGFRNVKQNTGFKGRWEILQQQPLVIADTAHNAEGLQEAINQWLSIPASSRHMVLGFVEDKSLEKILPLFPKQATYYFCKPNVPRGLDADRLQAAAMAYQLKGKFYPSVSEAYSAALSSCETSDSIYIGGSIFVVAEVV